MPARHDAIVIGAGPAGDVAASRLAEAGTAHGADRTRARRGRARILGMHLSPPPGSFLERPPGSITKLYYR